MRDEHVVFVTNVGSHTWRMDRPDSDLDLFLCFLSSTEKILNGTANTRSFFESKDGVDKQCSEIGTVVHQLIKGNLNYLIAVHSPSIIIDPYGILNSLKNFMNGNLSKNLYHSFHGMGLANYKKYVEGHEDEDITRKCNQISRVLRCGIEALLNGKMEFKPFENSSPDMVQSMLLAIDEACEESPLPDECPVKNDMLYWLARKRLDFYK